MDRYDAWKVVDDGSAWDVVGVENTLEVEEEKYLKDFHRLTGIFSTESKTKHNPAWTSSICGTLFWHKDRYGRTPIGLNIAGGGK